MKEKNQNNKFNTEQIAQPTTQSDYDDFLTEAKQTADDNADATSAEISHDDENNSVFLRDLLNLEESDLSEESYENKPSENFDNLFDEADEVDEDIAPTVNLAEIFAPYLPLKARQAAKLNKYRLYLLKKNQKLNLTAITDEYDVAVKHFLDSALGISFLPQGADLCDIGSGAGFPAVVLKILRKDIRITLVDSVGKKVEFLRRLCKKLDIEAERFNARAEQLALTRRETYDVVTARAVAALPTLLEYIAPLVKLNGYVLTYKGSDAETEIESAQKAASTLGLKLKSKNDFVLPNGDKRCIILYQKIAPTPRRYPRGQNLPKKKPII